MKKIGLVVFLGLMVIASFIFLIIYFIDMDKNSIFGFSERDSDNNFEEGFVGKVIDGDTVIINGESVRLLGIDSDERGYDCYNEAKKRMEELVLNKDVKMEKDITDKDQYKRLLRYLFVEDENNGEEINVNLKMIEEGLAIARFYEDRRYHEKILEAEKEARDNRIGCKWKDL